MSGVPVPPPPKDPFNDELERMERMSLKYKISHTYSSSGKVLWTIGPIDIPPVIEYESLANMLRQREPRHDPIFIRKVDDEDNG